MDDRFSELTGFAGVVRPIQICGSLLLRERLWGQSDEQHLRLDLYGADRLHASEPGRALVRVELSTAVCQEAAITSLTVKVLLSY